MMIGAGAGKGVIGLGVTSTTTRSTFTTGGVQYLPMAKQVAAVIKNSSFM